MLLISNNARKYIKIPESAVVRLNLAWFHNLETIRRELNLLESYSCWIDVPTGRTKPPNNQYNQLQVASLLTSYKNIKYVAISNVDTLQNLREFVEEVKNNSRNCSWINQVKFVPKIESINGFINLDKILNYLGQKPIIMIDSEDLYTDMLRKEIKKDLLEIISEIQVQCIQREGTVLLIRGVIFADS